MPRVEGEGVGGGDVDDGSNNNNNNNNHHHNNHNNNNSNEQQRCDASLNYAHSAGFGSWLGGAARAVSSSGTHGSTGGYIVLGGTRYGLRLSQESIPPSSREDSQDRGSRIVGGSRDSRFVRRENDTSRERLTEKNGTLTGEKQSMDLSASLADCCCIGPRSRLPLPRLSITSPIAGGNSVASDGGVDCKALSCNDSADVSVAGGRTLQSPPPASTTKNESARVPPNSNANNNRGTLQMVGQHPPIQQEQHLYSTQPRTTNKITTNTNNCRSLPSSFVPVAQTVTSVPRQIAQWTKHQTLKLQEPAVTAVDRLHRFRWSGGGGGSGKKSSSGPRSEKAERLRELTEKLKGPAPVPPPRRPSRLQASSPPPYNHQQSHADNQHSQLSPSNQDYSRNEGRSGNRSYTFSEGSLASTSSSSSGNGSVIGGTCNQPNKSSTSSLYRGNPKTFQRSESVGEECRCSNERTALSNDAATGFGVVGTGNGEGSSGNSSRAGSATSIIGKNNACVPLEPCHVDTWTRNQRDQRNSDGSDVVNLDKDYDETNRNDNSNNHQINNDPSRIVINPEAKHYRQSSDSLLDSGIKKYRQNPKDYYAISHSRISDGTIASGCSSNNDAEARDALARLEPRGPLLNYQKNGAPFRSASFGQADFSQVTNRQKIQPIAVDSNRGTTDGNKEVRASTLPRRRGDVTQIQSETDAENISNRPNSPRASTPSLDSAVGSAEGLGIVSQPVHEDTRPRSDGSDSLATSSALTSPEPPTIFSENNNKNNNDNRQQDHHQHHHPNHHHHLPHRETSHHNSVSSEVPTGELLAGEQTQASENTVEDVGNIARETWIEPHEVIITPPEEPRLSQASEGSEATSETPSPEALSPSGKIRRSRGDNSKRRKGVYITQWPEPSENDRSKLAAQSSEEREDPSITWSDLSDCEGHTPKRYSKRPLRGPYGQMLEAEMAKPRTTDIALEEGLRPRRKISANLSYTGSTNTSNSEPPTPCHHRTTSSPSKLESLPGPSPELLAELLRGSSERVARAPAHRNDTRNHVVVELYDTERSYVEALQILVNKYLQPLKSPETAGLVDAATVNEIFYQVPAILSHHEIFLEELRKRLETWELHQTIGDIFLEVFTKPNVLETYTLFLDNWRSAEKAIKTTCQAKPAFARFLETLEREHRGKLGLDQLLIKPVQKIPRYELLIQRLLKHTDPSHPDHDLLTAAQKEIHELVVKINCTEREILEWEQQQSILREVESLVDGLAGIVTKDRSFVRHDMVTIASNQGTRKERALFLFSDMMVITNIKRRSGTIRKPSTNASPNSLAGLPEANKYKMLMRIPLDDVEMIKAKEESLRKMAREVEHLKEDCSTLNQLQELAATLHGTKHQLEELIKEYLTQVQRQLAEKNAAHSQLACLELTLNTQNGVENITIMFTKPETRASWEESFNDAKQKLAMSADRRPPPEFIGPLPIRKTRAGLQFTCAAPTIATGQTPRDVWVCNSDGYVGQICVLSLISEPPNVESCNGVCNARILCIAAIPAPNFKYNRNILKNRPIDLTKSGISILVEDADGNGNDTQLDSSESSEDSEAEEVASNQTISTTASTAPGGAFGSDATSLDDVLDEETLQPTVWLGTEDGCIHIYNCNDNIRIKKNRIKIQHGSSVHSIMYFDNKVFVALANGDIVVYTCEYSCGWNTQNPITITVGTPAAPVTKMTLISMKLWCGCHNTVRILNTTTLEIEHSFAVSNDTSRPISCMTSSGGLGVWISLHNSAVLRLFHANSYECLTDINIASAVTKMLATGCDDIIRQHKAACLRVTALLSCNDLLWVGTSAGVLLNIPIPHLKPSSQRLSQPPPVNGIPHGHTGHVRFLTCVEKPAATSTIPNKHENRLKNKRHSGKPEKTHSNDPSGGKILVISGGDGYEDFRGPQASVELQAGREDSTNHLLLWKV
ncbi:uncharacterized protein [Venturia canescens]|uniref:uncharacterized protein isoform X2 n=1 Tax=Venturia canescens TaxID=32260 RepID=UPI001C9CC01F|nr:uncharacterized protein LOC122413601 isoform X2 [Venturia canescens]